MTNVSDVIESLLWAQISNVDPEDHATIMNRWQFIIEQALAAQQRPVWVQQSDGSYKEGWEVAPQSIAPTDKEPSVFIQWKGTDVCMDFYCECGAHCHFDGDFAYTVKCPHCSTVWEMPSTVYPRKADERTDAYWRENPKEMMPDEDYPVKQDSTHR